MPNNPIKVGRSSNWLWAVLALALAWGSPLTPPAAAGTTDLAQQSNRAINRDQLRREFQRVLALKQAGQYKNAEQLAKSLLDIVAGMRPVEPRLLALANITLADVWRELERFDEAERLLKSAIADLQALPGLDEEVLISPLGSLGGIYIRLSRFGDAEPILRRAVALAENAYGKSDPATAEMVNSLALLLASTGRPTEAEPLFRQVLSIGKKGGTGSADIAATAATNLANLYTQMKRNDEAAVAHKDAYARTARLYGPDHPSSIRALQNAGVFYRETGRLEDAEAALGGVLAFYRRLGDPDAPTALQALNNIGWLRMRQQRYTEALATFTETTAGYARLRQRESRGLREGLLAVSRDEEQRALLGYLRAGAEQATGSETENRKLVVAGFEAAQRVNTGAAATALTRAAARLAAGSGALATIAREGQDLALRYATLDRYLVQATATPPSARNPQQERAARAERDAIARTLDGLDRRINTEFPAYGALTRPPPVSVEEVQTLIGPQEALVFVTPFDDETDGVTFVWLVTKTDLRAAIIPMPMRQLAYGIDLMRCGLDPGAWSDEAQRAFCARETGVSDPGFELPFDAELSHGLYQMLFSGFEPGLAGKSLIIVAPHPLAALPFQVLLRKPAAQRYPKGVDQLRTLDWFGRSTPMVVLPSVAALRAQRQPTSAPAAPEPYLGFGDPVLVGNRACVIPEVPSACPTFSATGSAPTRNARPRAIGPSRQATRLLRNGVVDVDAVRALCPLPDTAAELRCVAASLGAPTERVLLGPAATVSAARATDLSRFRILHFATHGLVAGDIATTSGALNEPALVMTPPATAIPGDDGLLRVSDIVTLRLNADWVILSACNTAAGRGPRGEALSGLASAFLYAGARSLLVSHWPVRSDAAVQLTSRAIRAMAADPAMTRAEAMRRAMVELIDASPPDMAHPSVWAPFSVVGDARLTPP